jgi:NAD(P)-dependent dehydrogenase (short-subunit alcohol dehydrogenase family)
MTGANATPPMQGHRALVTGASMSIGRSIALAFAEAGADTALHYSAKVDAALGQPDAIGEVAARAEAFGVRAPVIDLELTQPGAGRDAVERAAAALGGIDVLVVCASVQRREPFLDASRQSIDWQTQVNFVATIDLLQAAIPKMTANGWGRILTIGSVNSERPHPELAVYAALKSAQKNLSLNLARSLAASGITVNVLSPGLIATERNRSRRVDTQAWETIQRLANPMGRAGLPDEMANAAVLLCSRASGFITGADLQATGGAHL